MFKMLFEQRCSVITTLCKIHHLINSYYKIGMDIRKRKNLESIKLCKISLNLLFWCWPNYSGLEWQTWIYFCLKNIVLLSYFLSFHLLTESWIVWNASTGISEFSRKSEVLRFRGLNVILTWFISKITSLLWPAKTSLERRNHIFGQLFQHLHDIYFLLFSSSWNPEMFEVLFEQRCRMRYGRKVGDLWSVWRHLLFSNIRLRPVGKICRRTRLQERMCQPKCRLWNVLPTVSWGGI